MYGQAGIILGGPRRRARPFSPGCSPGSSRSASGGGRPRHGRGLAQAPRPAQALQAAGAGRSVRSPTRRSTRSWPGSTTAPRYSWITPAGAPARPPEERAQEAARFRAALPASRSPWRTLATRGWGVWLRNWPRPIPLVVQACGNPGGPAISEPANPARPVF